MADIKDYKDFLSKLAEEESDEFINNSSMDHAAVMIEVLFSKANGTACILTDHLNPLVYDRYEVKKAAEEFLKKADSKLDVIMQFNDTNFVMPPKNGFLSSLTEYKNKITLFRAKNELRKLNKHFMVTTTAKGNYALRFETDLKDKIATGTFNAGDPGKKLLDFFKRKKVDESESTRIKESEIWPDPAFDNSRQA